MDAALRARFKQQIAKLAECDWIEYNNPRVVLEYIEANVTSLGNIWRNIQTNLANIRQEAGKNAVVSLSAYNEAKFRLDKLKRNSKTESDRVEALKKVLTQINEAIATCPHSPSTTPLAKLYALRSCALFEADQPNLALVAINRALLLEPDSGLYHANKARYLIHLQRYKEALLHIKQAIQVCDYPRAIEEEEATNNPFNVEEMVTMERLQSLRIEIERKVNNCSCDDDDSNGSDLDTTAEDEYDSPYTYGTKNFTIDYRCQIMGQPNVGKGRYYAATQEIEAETPILRERYYSLVILPEMILLRCHYCARDVTNRFWPCSTCAQAVYCGDKCALLDWKLSHHFDCGLTRYWNNRSKSTFHVFRLFNRIGVHSALKLIEEDEHDQVADKHQLEHNSEQTCYDLLAYSKDKVQRFTPPEEKDHQLLCNEYRAQMTLLSHSDNYDIEYLYTNIANAIECAMMACIAQGIEFDQISRQHMLQLIGHCFVFIRRVLTNAFRWSKSNEQGVREHIATYYMLVSSLFNHSCDPNTEWNINNGYLTMTTLRVIEPEEEITISYGPSISDHFEERQKRLLEGYFFQCNCTACVKECRAVLALQCPVCPGPVLSNPKGSDSHCLVCFELYPGAKEKLNQLERAREEVAIKAQLINCTGFNKSAYFDSIKQSLEQIFDTIYSQSNRLIESIYTACKVFYQENMLQDCVHYGAVIDQIMSSKNGHLLVIADSKGQQAYSSHGYKSMDALDLNIEHLIFWCAVYHTWIECTKCKDEKVWSELLRFNRHLQKLLKSTITMKERQLNELGANSKDTFKAVGLREEINILDSLKWYKHRELKRLKDKYGHQLTLELADIEL